MTRIAAELFSTLDGRVSSPQDWHGLYWTPEAGAATERLLGASQLMLLGRNTYLEHAAYWPTDTGTMADLMNGIPKLVVSTTLDRADWENTSIARDGLEAALDSVEGRDIVVTGSVALVKSLLRIGRLDELRLIVDPVVAGSGTRLFDDGTDIGLTLIESKPQDSGAVSLHYAVGAR